MRLAPGGRTVPTRRRRQSGAAWLLVVCTAFMPLCAVGAVSAAPTAQPGGVVLDGWGGLHAFGGASVNAANAPYWPGWDIARAVAVRPDGSGGWTLDGFGGIKAWGGAAAVATPAYWPGWDIARDMVFTSRGTDGQVDGSQGYLLDGFGGIHPWGGATPLAGPYPGSDVARSMTVDYDTNGTPDGGWVLYSDGSLHAFGAATGKAAPAVPAGGRVWAKIRGSTASGYVVAHWGTVRTWGGVRPYWAGYSDWQTWDIERDIAILRADNPQAVPQPQSAPAAAIFAAAQRPSGGVTLDGFGGLHVFGETPVNTTDVPYWPNWDIARAVQTREDGSGGWTLDGFGGIHAWGSAPPAATPAYWAGWDVARSFVVTSHDSNGLSNGVSGYLLDAFGGIHPWGNAPAIGAPPYMGGFDVYRGLVVHTDSQGTPDGGWAMDNVGHTYAFGSAPAIGDATPYAGRPMYHALHQTAFGWYTVAQDGVVISFGGYAQPSWTNWADWQGWDIARDIALINPTDPQAPAQPVSSGAAGGFTGAVNGLYLLNVPMTRQVHPLDCEAATLQMVLAARGTSVSQDWELAYWGADLRPAVKDSAGNIVQWGDPYTAFVGNVNASEWNATGYGIYYPPLVRVSQYLGHSAIGKEQWSISKLFDLVVSGYPAAVEGSFNMQYATPRTYTAWDGRSVQYILNNHVFALVGVNFGTQQVIINDPYTATRKVYSWADFARSFSYINNMATVVS